MSMRTGFAVAAAICAMTGLVGSAYAEMAAPPKIVTLTGCPTRGVQDGCTVLKGPRGARYNITSANPAAPIGTWISLEGTVTFNHSNCGDFMLDNIKWKKVWGNCQRPKGAK